MQVRNTEHRYGLVGKSLHWAIALLILGLVWLGWVMVDMTYYDRWYNAALVSHRALGMLVLGLAAFKIVWRIVSPNPMTEASLKPWEKVASKGAHWILFGLMFLIPVTGYFISTSSGDPVPFFNWFDIPALWTISEGARDLAIEIHYYTAYGILFLVAAHAGAALKHHFIDRNDTLRRML